MSAMTCDLGDSLTRSTQWFSRFGELGLPIPAIPAISGDSSGSGDPGDSSGNPIPQETAQKSEAVVGDAMKTLWALCMMLLVVNLRTSTRDEKARPVKQPKVQEQAAQDAQPQSAEQEAQADPDAQMLAQTGSIYQNTTISQITSQSPGGVWGISGHVQVTGFVMAFARQADGDLHVPFCDSPHFTVAANGSSLPDKHHCVMAEVVPYLRCSVLPHLPAQQTIRGLLRFDGGPATQWWEIHPIEFMSSGSCHVVGTPSVP